METLVTRQDSASSASLPLQSSSSLRTAPSGDRSTKVTLHSQNEDTTYEDSIAIAALLPEEVLLIIFEEAGKSTITLASYDPDYPQLFNHTLVCRRWLQPACRALWTSLHSSNASRNALIFHCVISQAPAFGRFVRSLDTRGVFEDAGHVKVMRRLLDSLPLLTCLAVHKKQMKHLCSHPAWQRLQVLRLTTGYDEDLPPSHRFPPQLRVLIILRTIAWIDLPALQSLSQLHLPALRCLVFQAPQTQSWRSSGITQVKRFFPDAAMLSRLQIQWPQFETFAEGLTRSLRTMLCEAAPFLQHLKLTEVQGNGQVFLSLPLKSLVKLETLIYDGQLMMDNEDGLLETFPSSLQQLDVSWSGNMVFGLSLLRHLHDPTFLPKLTIYPTVVWRRYRVWDTPDAAIKQQQKECVTLAASLALNFDLLRINVDLPTILSHCTIYCLPLLPVPFNFRTLLSMETATMVKEVEKTLLPEQYRRRKAEAKRAKSRFVRSDNRLPGRQHLRQAIEQLQQLKNRLHSM